MRKLKQKWLIWCAAAICLLALCVGVSREAYLEHVRNTALTELEARAGEYDAQSIMLAGTNVGRANELAKKLSAELRITADGTFATLTLPEGVTVRDVFAQRENRTLIQELSVDYRASISDFAEYAEIAHHDRHNHSPRYPISDSEFERQTYLDYMNMSTVWQTTKGNGVLVAVIDTGIDTDHAEFAGKISEYSYNATSDKVVKDYDFSLIEDEQGHGTAVAGVIAASMDNAGTVGIAPEVELLIIKAECDENGNFYRTSDLVFGLYYAIERSADVVNMSFGSSGQNPFAEAARLACDSDILCVAAAGNEATTEPAFPAADENVLGVGSLAEDSWELASYSNYGDNVNLVAPGTVYTTLIDGKYGVMSGTSFSAPAVSGALALYLTCNRYPTVDSVTEVLYASCADLGSLGEDWLYGYGAVDVSALILEEKGSVAFNMQTDELENTTQIFVREHTLQDIPEPERLYAVFDGWYYDPQCTEEYQWYEDEFSADLTLYAKWANEDDALPFTYVTLADDTVEIRSYTGHRRYITIPDSIDGKTVSSIGKDAFADESRLRQVNLPQNLKTICDGAFYGCTSLSEIHIPNTVKTIGENAFYGNTRLYAVELGSGIESIGNYAFAGCVSLSRFELPGHLKYMDGTALFGTTSMQAFGVRSGNTDFAVKDGVLFNKSGTTLIAYPAGRSGNYTLPNNVHTIGVCAFGYTRADQVDLNKVRSVEQEAFAFSRLSSVTIPNSVTSIGTRSFGYSSFLSQIKIGTGLKEISESCFTGCSALASIEIPANITAIGVEAFCDCNGLQTVAFAPNSRLTHIACAAFARTDLEAIRIPASVASIGDQVFLENYHLSSVTFESGSVLGSIGNHAFYRTCSLEQIALPGHLYSLGEFAFAESALTDVSIPASLTGFGAGAFASCHELEQITVDAANISYTSENGVVYDADMKTLVAYPAGKNGSSFTIPDSVRTVDTAAFYGSHILTEVTIPAGVELLGEHSFYDCRNVVGYSVSEGLVEIMSYAFSKNSSLRSFSVPDSVEQISRYAFAEDYSLVDVYISESTSLPRLGYAAFAYSGIREFRVPANISTLAQGVFEGCESLTSIVFSSGSKLDSIAAYTFDGCENLKSIVFESGSALTTIEAHGFEGMRNLTTIDFGDAKLTEIGNFAFRFCEKLQTVTVPESLINIGRFAFYGCERLSSITLPAGMEHIGSYAFHGAENLNLYFKADFLPIYLDENWDNDLRGYHVGVNELKSSGAWEYAVLNSGNISIIGYNGSEKAVDMNTLSLGGDIVGIGGHAFYRSSVTKVVLPDTLTTIQAYAFAESDLENIAIPASVNFIGRNAFAYSKLGSVSFAENSGLKVIEQEAFANTDKLAEITLPKSLTTLGSRAFLESGLTSLTFEPGIALAEIPEQAFAGSGLTYVNIPDSVTLINHGAFRDCRYLSEITLGAGKDLYIASNVFYNTALTSVHIPENVGYIGEYAFVGLTELNDFTVSSGNPYYAAIDGLLVSKDGRKLIAVPAARSGSMTVPACVEEIGFGAFENSRLSSVSFVPGSNILTLGYRAFYDAENLKSIAIPASVVSIDYYAFANCSALERVSFAEGSRLTGIYEGAFYGCANLHDITLPDSIIEISDFAFYGCRALDRIPVGDAAQLKGIYSHAFAYSGISGDFTTPENLIDIGDYAFMGTGITKLTIPDTKQKELIIGIGAFEDCIELTEVTLPFIGASFEDPDIPWFGYIFGAGSYRANGTYVPESLKTVTVTEGISIVGKHAFFGSDRLEWINVPHSVVYIGERAFRDTSAIYELTNTVQIEGLDEFYGGASELGWGLTGKLVLAGGITHIHDHAFQNCYNLESVVIPDSVTSIGAGAFADCWSLISVKLPNDLTTIPDSMFFGCSGLSEISLPDSVSSIGDYSFYGCNSLIGIDIPDSVTAIKEGAFESCEKLTRISLGRNVVDIGADAFLMCYSVYSVKNNSRLELALGDSAYGGIAENASVLIDKDGNKSYKDNSKQYIETEEGFLVSVDATGKYTLHAYLGSETTIILPETINGKPYEIYRFSGGVNIVVPGTVVAIDNYAFYYNKTLESIVIQEGTTSIGVAAFSHCTALEKVVLPDGLTRILQYAFRDCVKLDSIILPNSLTDIGYRETFLGCTALTEINIPGGVESIGYDVFKNCTKLENVTVSYGVAAIEDNAFNGCVSLSQLVIPETVKYIGTNVFDGEIVLDGENVNYCVVDGILYTADMSLIRAINKNVSGEVTLPSTITSIYDNMFAGCASLESVIIPDSVVSIGEFAFSGCTAMKNITIPDSVRSIGACAFNECSALSSITLPDGVSQIENALGGYSSQVMVNESNPYFQVVDGVIYDKPATKILYVPKTVSGKITIPDGVTEVYGFRNSGVEEIELPHSVKTISASAFEYCENLSYVGLNENLNSIGQRAFIGCTALKSITLPNSVRTIGDSAFEHCWNLEKVFAGGNIVSVGERAFLYCKSLLSVELPDSVTFIGESAFYGCESLMNMRIPKGVAIIHPSTFLGCVSLTNVELHDDITAIGEFAFNGCENLPKIALPAKLTEIGDSAFASCSCLFEIINNSSLNISFIDNFSNGFGKIGVFAKIIVDKEGNPAYREGYEDFRYIETDEGFLFIHYNNTYELLAYLGDQQKVTLPSEINGDRYRMYRFRGAREVHLPADFMPLEQTSLFARQYLPLCYISASDLNPEYTSIDGILYNADCSVLIAAPPSLLGETLIQQSVTEIGDRAFYNCKKITEIALPNSVKKIGVGVFSNCVNLTEVHFPGVTELYSEFSSCENLIANQQYWHDGIMTIDNCLISVSDQVEYCDWDKPGYACSTGAFSDAVMLKQVSVNTECDLGKAKNLEKLIVDGKIDDLAAYFGYNIPATLDTVVLKSDINVNSIYAFEYMSDITIFVEENWIDSGAAWDVSFPGWNNGNTVYYGDEWNTICFYDVNGNILSREFLLTSQIIRQPYYAIESDEHYDYTLIGWDIDGDGLADHIPATSSVDINAYPVVEKAPRKYTVTFYDKDAQTVLHAQSLTYGSLVTLPPEPEKQGYTFLGWSGYTDGMTATENVSLYSRWEHIGKHNYSTTEAVEPACTEPGGIRHICDVCGEGYLSDHIEPTGHSYTSVTVRGCDEMGYDLHTCTECGDSYKDSFTAAEGHSYGEWSVLTEATCTADGQRTRSCLYCGQPQTETVPAVPHNVETTVTKEATCTERGELTHLCTVCGDTTTESIAAASHKYEMKRVPMSFLEWLFRLLANILWGYDGDTAYYFVCTDCDRIQTVEESTVQASAAGAGCTHTDSDWSVAYEPNCIAEGVEWRICGLCGQAIEARTYGAAGAGHAYKAESFDSETHHLVCMGCNDEVIEAHTWSDSNRCLGCNLSGVTAALSGKTLAITAYNLPDKDCLFVVAGYAYGGRMISCDIVGGRSGNLYIPYETGDADSVVIYVVDTAWVPLMQPVSVEK